jgi:hypothetical protein
VHLRRALLLFAIVLGLAAIVTTISQPPRREATSPPSPGASGPAPVPTPVAGGVRRIRLSVEGKPVRARLDAGRPATVTVTVRQPGQVDIRGLGLTDAAERSSPASFDVLTPRPGRYVVDFTPAGGSSAEMVGTIVVPPPPG